MTDLLRDARHGLRLMNRSRVFTALVVITLALGIGAAIAVISIMEAQIWRPLPFPQPQELVSIAAVSSDEPTSRAPFATADYLAMRRNAQSVSGIAGFRWSSSRVVRGRGAAERASVRPVTGNFFDVLGLRAGEGRTFSVADESSGERVAMLGSAFRDRVYGAGASPIGETLLIDDVPHRIVGVTPKDRHFEFIPDADIFVPISTTGTPAGEIVVVGRLAAGASLGPAAEELQPLYARFAADKVAAGKTRVDVADLRSAYASNTWRTFAVFLGAAIVLFVIACANVANLMMARGLARRREFMVRAALGGTRAQIARQLIVEATLIAGAAGLAGLALGAFGVKAFVALAPADYVSRGRDVILDARIIAITIGLSALTAIIIGLLPGRGAAKLEAGGALGRDARNSTADPRHRRTRSALMFVEVTMAFLLLFGAGILVNSFVRLNRAPLGFEAGDLVTMRLLLKSGPSVEPAALLERAETLSTRLAALPGVKSVTLSNTVPIAGGDAISFRLPGREQATPPAATNAVLHITSPNYLDVFGISLRSGRAFTAADAAGAPKVAMINETLARRFFPERNPVGQELELVPRRGNAGLSGRFEIVGVMSNVHEVGIDEVAFNSIYVPLRQFPLAGLSITVSAADPATIGDTIRRDVQAFDQEIPIYNVASMKQLVEKAMTTARFNMAVFGGLAALAVLLASVGVYGSTSHDTAARTPEFGLRLALGASRREILATALGRPSRLAVFALVTGLGAAIAIARATGDALYLVQGKHNGVIYQVSLTDPLTLGMACLLIISIAALAAYVPARRATRLDPLQALRDS